MRIDNLTKYVTVLLKVPLKNSSRVSFGNSALHPKAIFNTILQIIHGTECHMVVY